MSQPPLPQVPGAAAKDWLAARQAELLPVPYYHLVFTLPAAIARIAYQNKAHVYRILFRAASQTLLTIAADPKHLGAKIGITAVLHTCGSAMTHHPHIHCIVPGGGLSLARGENGASPTATEKTERWISCRPGFFLPVRVLSRLFRRLFLEKLEASLNNGDLTFYNELASFAEPGAFTALLRPLRKTEWVVYAKKPFAGPEAVLAYLARHTHRVAIANRRLIAFDDRGVTFKWKDYRAKARDRQKIMTLKADELIRRFLIHVLPQGFHRIRYYGLFANGGGPFANGGRGDNLAHARELLNVEPPHDQPVTETDDPPQSLGQPRPRCGGRMIIIETFDPEYTPSGHPPRAPPQKAHCG